MERITLVLVVSYILTFGLGYALRAVRSSRRQDRHWRR